MKTVGIVGGIAPESTIDYYRLIIVGYREQVRDGSYPSIVIDSIDLTRMLGMVVANDLPKLAEYLTGEVQKLARAGADFGLLASNTPHIVFDEVRRGSPIPLRQHRGSHGRGGSGAEPETIGLFGTRFTMQGSFYPTVLATRGITVVAPAPDEQAYIHDRYMTELVKGLFLPETLDRLLAIVERLKEQDHIQGLILGGTELPLALRHVGDRGIPFLDTTKIHVEAIVKEMLR